MRRSSWEVQIPAGSGRRGLERPLWQPRILDRAFVTSIEERSISAADEDAQLSDLAALVKIAGRTAKCNMPAQDGLFNI